jgi:hypothetical protein
MRDPRNKMPSHHFRLEAKAPKYLGFAKNIIDTAGHFIMGSGFSNFYQELLSCLFLNTSLNL